MAARDEKVIPAQKEVLVNFMEANLEFARGKLLSVEGRLESLSLWEMLCQQLNVIGPEKTVQKWQRVWTQMKTKVKRKASSLAASQRRTGGGPPTETPLTDMEEKIIFIISREGVFGLEGPDGVSLESDVPCADIAVPSTSSHVRAVQGSWVSLTEGSENAGTDVESVFSTEASTTEASEPEFLTPRNSRKKSNTADAIESLMEQTESTNSNIAKLTNEMHEVRNVLSNILQEHQSTNSILERIACALEHKK